MCTARVLHREITVVDCPGVEVPCVQRHVDISFVVLVSWLLLMPPFPRLGGAWGPWDLATSWWLEQVVGVELLEWEG